MCAARRSRLERAIYDAGYASRRDFARAGGFGKSTLDAWLRCSGDPSPRMRRRIAEALDLCWGADADCVWLADVDWLLEPCDESG